MLMDDDSAFQARAARLPAFRLVTGNSSKLLEASRILGFEPASVDVDLPEVQSLDLFEVLRHKADSAAAAVEGAIVVEETGLELDAMNGFPGPLVKWMLEAMGPEGIARIAQSTDSVVAHARCALLYRSSEAEVVVEGVCSGSLILPPRGETGFGWDPVLVPEGCDLTCAELGDESKDRIGHRGRAWRALVDRLVPKDGGR